MSRLGRGGALALEAFREWVRDRCDGLAAAMAFDALLAIAPLMAIVLILATALLGKGLVREKVAPVIQGWAGPHGVAVLKFLLADTEHVEPEALVSFGVVGLIGLLVGASGYFFRLQNSLEAIWGVRRQEAKPSVQLKRRAYGLLYAAASAVVVLVGLLGATFVRSIGRSTVATVMESMVAFATFWALAAFWFRVLPPVRLTWRQIIPWAAFAAALHLLGRLVLTARATRQEAGLGIGAAESLILVMLWFYYASLIFLYAAELMRVSLQRHGGLQPAPPRAAGVS